MLQGNEVRSNQAGTYATCQALGTDAGLCEQSHHSRAPKLLKNRADFRIWIEAQCSICIQEPQPVGSHTLLPYPELAWLRAISQGRNQSPPTDLEDSTRLRRRRLTADFD
jgi:hypothetical protein